MAPKKNRKKAERTFVSNPAELAELAAKIGPELDNPPVSLDRGSYVSGALSFGSLVLDLISGGGAPPGKFTSAYGPPGSGKSTLTYHLIGSALRSKVPVYFFDHESSADAKYLRSLGVRIRLDNGKKNPYFNYFQPTTGESTYRMMARLLRALPDYKAGPDGSRPLPQALFAVDSVASMLAEAYDIDDENAQLAVTAKVHSKYLPLIKSKLGRKNVSLFATNQLRLNPGQMFGSPEYQPGGQAVVFYPDLTMRMNAVGKVFSERNRSMRFVNISTKKNKQFVPFLDVKDTLAVAFGRGFERGRDTMGYLYLTGQLKKATGRRNLDLKVDADYDWNNKGYYESDLIPLLCTNKFRNLCYGQLESGSAFEMFFAENDWSSLYSDFDEEAAEDAENVFEKFTSSLSTGGIIPKDDIHGGDDDPLEVTSEGDYVEELEVSSPPPPPKQRRRRKSTTKTDALPKSPPRKKKRRTPKSTDDIAEDLLSS